MTQSFVKVPNKVGHFKTFTSLAAPGVAAWKESVEPPKRYKKTAGVRTQESIDRAADRKAAKEALQKRLYEKAEDAIASAFDGGDPIDYLSPFLDRHGFTIEDVDRIYKKLNKTDYYGYVAQMWDDHQSDRMSDARANPKSADRYSDYFSIEDDGTVVAKDNPWKSS